MLPQRRAVDKREVNGGRATPFNREMKYLAAALALATVAAMAAQPTERASVDLRRTLQQYPAESTPQPRQLTAVERAELRRQLSESRQPPQRRLIRLPSDP